MSNQWSPNPGYAPPTPPSTPAGWDRIDAAPTAPPGYGAGPPLPSLPPPGPRRSIRRTTVIITSMAVVIAMLAVGLTYLWVTRPDETVAAGGASTTTTAPSTTSRPSTTTTTPRESPTPPPGSVPVTPPSTAPSGPAPTQAEVEAVVAEISAFVEKERGLTFKTPAKVELLPDDAFNQRLLADFDEDREEIDRSGKVLKALGLIGPDVNVAETMKLLLSAGVLGFYDPETKALVVRAHQLTPYTKQTIAHELVHALDDQHFDLNRKDFDEKKDESMFGWRSVAEGDARRIESAYVAAMTPADKRARDREEAEFASTQMGVLAQIPPILVNMISAPYEWGQPLVAAIFARGGNDLVASAFITPPITSSQVLHPDLFFANTQPLPVDKPKADGKEIEDQMFGELMTRLTLEDGAAAEAVKAGEGWGGDWYVLWEDGDNGAACIRIAYKMTTPRDLDELESAYTTWAEDQAHQGAEISRTDDGLEVTSCSAAPAGGRSPA